MSEQLQEIHVDDVGTIFEITFINPTTKRPLNISDASLVKMLFLVPPINDTADPTLVEKTAEFVTDGADGRVRYTTITGDISVPGRWKLQGRVTTPDGQWSSNEATFKVIDNL